MLTHLINELLTLHDAAIKSNVVHLRHEIRYENGVISNYISCPTPLVSREEFEHFVHDNYVFLNI